LHMPKADSKFKLEGERPRLSGVAISTLVGRPLAG